MKYANLEWRNGQPYSPEFDDVYFSADHGIEETEHVFIQHNHLQQRFTENRQPRFVIAETGFGSGLNFLLSVKHWLDLSRPQQTLYFYSLESTPFSPADIKLAQQSWPELKTVSDELLQQYCVASYGFHCFHLFNGRVKLVLMIGEAQVMLAQMSAAVDAWFLDGFAPGCNPGMWNENVFSQISRLSAKGATFSTYTAAGFVRRGLSAAGFDVEKVSGTGKKRHMLRGVLSDSSSMPLCHTQPWYETETSPIENKSAIVIGAGIAGMSSALALVKRGYKVTIIEAGSELGTQASGNPQGMLMPRLSLQDSADAEFYTSAYFYALRALNLLDSQQTCWQQTGGMQLACTERVKKQIVSYPQDASLAQVLDAQRATGLSGLNIDEPVHYFPLAACVLPKKILQCMMDEMADALHILFNTQVSSVKYKNDQWQLFSSQNEFIGETQCLVLANAWQAKRFKQLEHVHLQPARGQLSYFQANQQSKKLRMPVSFEAYLMPEYNGQHVSGASFELDDCDTRLRDDEFKANLADINIYFKGLFSETDICDGRASVRAVTPDRIPVVGEINDQQQALSDYNDLYMGKPASRYSLATALPGLYINTGHGARGFSSAFLSAELLGAMICDEPLPVSNRVRYALHSSRFLIRSLKKRRV